ncbi:MAG: Nif3-like dinuclear metal center hexameric protein [Acidobacteriota bacterium]
MDRNVLVRFLDDYLESDNRDYCPNGLQVEGTPRIERVVTAVSSCEEVFDRARELDADAVLVHHGVFWHGQPLDLTGFRYRRVKALMDGDINLIAYHLPLDRHGEVGNNALAARAFGLEELGTFAEAKGQPIGFKGRFPEPISAEELVARCARIYDQAPLTFAFGPDPVRTLGIISGGAQGEFYTAIDEGLDAYITGEVSEWVMNVAKETGTHYLAAGHYATERLGIRRLGELIAERFGLDVTYVDVPNPV